MADIKDRIVELRRVKASELQADERNWRQHPEAQRKVYRAAAEDLGHTDAVLAPRDARGPCPANALPAPRPGLGGRVGPRRF